MLGVGFRRPALPISVHVELRDGDEEEQLDRERRGLMCYVRRKRGCGN